MNSVKNKALSLLDNNEKKMVKQIVFLEKSKRKSLKPLAINRNQEIDLIRQFWRQLRLSIVKNMPNDNKRTTFRGKNEKS